MALLPSQDWVIQQIDGTVVLYQQGTEEEIVRFDPANSNETAQAQKVIYDDPRLSDEDKSFAHFWSGYFYAYAHMQPEEHDLERRAI